LVTQWWVVLSLYFFCIF